MKLLSDVTIGMCVYKADSDIPISGIGIENVGFVVAYNGLLYNEATDKIEPHFEVDFGDRNDVVPLSAIFDAKNLF